MSALSETDWAATFRLNAVRVAAATVVMAVVVLILVIAGAHPRGESPLGFIFMPVVFLTVGSGMYWLFRALGKIGIPIMDAVAGFMKLVIVIFVVIGDPLVWFVRRFYPALVPVERFGFVNFVPFILVQRAPADA
ncbi:MAG: hypothetical protein WDM86_11155 [Rhizomicrobium sp.]